MQMFFVFLVCQLISWDFYQIYFVVYIYIYIYIFFDVIKKNVPTLSLLKKREKIIKGIMTKKKWCNWKFDEKHIEMIKFVLKMSHTWGQTYYWSTEISKLIKVWLHNCARSKNIERRDEKEWVMIWCKIAKTLLIHEVYMKGV